MTLLNEPTDVPTVVAVSRNVYVATLPQTLNDAELMNLFAPFGVVLSAKIMREKKTRQSKGYGFVLFRDEESAVAAVAAMHNATIHGHSGRLQVRLAHPTASKDLSKQCRVIPSCQAVARPQQQRTYSTSSLEPTPMAGPQFPFSACREGPMAAYGVAGGMGGSMPPLMYAPQQPCSFVMQMPAEVRLPPTLGNIYTAYYWQ